MYICIPEEYKNGYIERRLSTNEKIVSKNYFNKIDLELLKKTIRTLINVAKIKETNMKTRFEPNILIVTALPKEFQAFKDLMQDDPRYDPALGSEKIQFPHYKLGNMDIVLAMSSMGNNFSSAIATKMLEKYPSIEQIIMVGIAGGIPNIEKPDKHIRLGDIVVSGEKGIIQYDMGKQTSNGFEHNFSPRPVSALLLRNAIVLVEDKGKNEFEFWEKLDSLLKKDRVKYMRREQGILDDTPWIKESTVELPKAPEGYNNNRPRVHIGAIASSNLVLKDAKERNKLIQDFPSVKAVEMEASGLADASWLHGKDCFVIRGICDYCNPSKHKEWQEYAAAAAAAFAIDLIKTL
jgi:nucleoside phosphorylase